AMIAVGGIFEAGVFELLQQKGHSFEAVAAMAISAVSEKTHHGFVDLNTTRGLRAIGGDCSLGALRRDGAGTVRDEQPDQDLQRSRLGFRRLLAGKGKEENVRHVPSAESFLARDAAKAAVLVMLGGNRGADHHAIETQIPGKRFRGEARNALAHQWTP